MNTGENIVLTTLAILLTPREMNVLKRHDYDLFCILRPIRHDFQRRKANKRMKVRRLLQWEEKRRQRELMRDPRFYLPILLDSQRRF